MRLSLSGRALAGGRRQSMLLWGAALALGIAIIAVVLVKAWPLLHPTVTERAPLSPGCDLLRERCAVRFATGSEVELDIRPRGIPTVHPLELRVTLEGFSESPQRVEIDFAGVDMAMGLNRTSLDLDAESGAWIGQGMLPVCVRDRMTWEARVLVYQSDQLFAAPFRFVSSAPGAQ